MRLVFCSILAAGLLAACAARERKTARASIPYSARSECSAEHRRAQCGHLVDQRDALLACLDSLEPGCAVAETEAEASRDMERDRRDFQSACARRTGNVLWAAYQASRWTSGQGLECPMPDHWFDERWRNVATREMQTEMVTCLARREPYAECEAALEGAFAERLAARRDDLPAGTYEWADASFTKGKRCDAWESTRLTLTIDPWGGAKWYAFTNAATECDDGTSVPLHCGHAGTGHVELHNGGLRLVTTERGAVSSGGTAPVATVWKCGKLKVHMPSSWEPGTRQLKRACVRLGSAADPVADRVSAAACQHSTPFPELDGAGVMLDSSTPGQLSFTHGGAAITLTDREGGAQVR